jgi:hypothetical protein
MVLKAMNQYMHSLIAFMLVELTLMLGLEKYFLSESDYEFMQEGIPGRLIGHFVFFSIAGYFLWNLP